MCLTRPSLVGQYPIRGSSKKDHPDAVKADLLPHSFPCSAPMDSFPRPPDPLWSWPHGVIGRMMPTYDPPLLHVHSYTQQGCDLAPQG